MDLKCFILVLLACVFMMIYFKIKEIKVWLQNMIPPNKHQEFFFFFFVTINHRLYMSVHCTQHWYLFWDQKVLNKCITEFISEL